jgi:protein-S-isoprenylcysteine O-methyltransferase Ste14
MRSRWPLALLGLGLNTLLLRLPALLGGRSGAGLGDPAVRLFLVGAGLLCLGDLLLSPPASADAAPDAPTTRLAWANGLALLLTFWTALATCGPGTAAFGFAAMLAGVLLRAAAIRQLGGSFVTAVRVTPGQELLRRGVYAHLRHPSETGVLLAALGGCLLLGSGAGLAVGAALLVPLACLRVRREDAVLARAFGPAHADYVRRVGALLPSLWKDGPGSSAGGRMRRVSSR